jgi:hypothetical protein
MKLHQKLLLVAKLKLCEIIDTRLLPKYTAAKVEVFKLLEIPLPAAEAAVPEAAAGPTPQMEALSALYTSLASTTWQLRDVTGYNNSEFLLMGISTKPDSEVVLMLQDRFNNTGSVMSLHEFLEHFQPLAAVRVAMIH